VNVCAVVLDEHVLVVVHHESACTGQVLALTVVVGVELPAALLLALLQFGFLLQMGGLVQLALQNKCFFGFEDALHDRLRLLVAADPLTLELVFVVLGLGLLEHAFHLHVDVERPLPAEVGHVDHLHFARDQQIVLPIPLRFNLTLLDPLQFGHALPVSHLVVVFVEQEFSILVYVVDGFV